MGYIVDSAFCKLPNLEQEGRRYLGILIFMAICGTPSVKDITLVLPADIRVVVSE